MGSDLSCDINFHATVSDCVNYAGWQNSVPILKRIQIENATDEDLSDFRIELDSVPAIVAPKTWTLDRVNAHSVHELKDRDVQIDAEYLNGLDEAERGKLRFRLILKDKVVGEAESVIRILARDEWGGMEDMGELLAAFVTPNDPALAPLLKDASEVLARHGHSPALDGYQTHDASRAYMLAAAIWSAVAGRSLTYANPPSSFEQDGQKTRRVSTVLQDGLATCLDSSLLFASALEAVGLNAAIVMQQGHCFTGVWLVEKTFNRLIESDCTEVRKAIAAREFVTFETTQVTSRPPGRFQDAVATAAAATHEDEESKFVAAIDIARARMAQVRPLASHTPRADATGEDASTAGPLPLPAAPKFEDLYSTESVEAPATEEGRINRWQRKLLDLSLRNRLLNFRATKQTIPILCTDIPHLEDILADGKRLKLISLSEHNPIGDRDSELHHQKTNEDLDAEFASDALERRELACTLGGADLNRRLTTLYRKAKNDLTEGGSNTLFLAVGFLRWKQAPNDAKTYRAPILLVPVKLQRRSASSPYYLAHHEDEVRFNATLIQLLKKDFDCDISHFESNLPTDDSGIDVPRVMDRMRAAVRDIPRFEVIDETALSTFSFAKYLMWKDLVDRTDQLKNNRVVRHLIENPDKEFQGGSGTIPKSHEIDVRYSPSELVHPLPADSSQLAAIMAASEGQDYVLVGPPGTGKSQTIANLIAQCLSTGKTVLFVAEKTAALDVVYRRLREHGLGDCCVELHSNKAERRRFLDQLGASWENNRRASQNVWVSVSERLKVRRDQLNDYVSALHTPHANGWTAYRAMGVLVRGRAVPAPRLEWVDTVRHDKAVFENLTRTVDDLAATYAVLQPGSALPEVSVTEWSAAWESSLLEKCAQLKASAVAMKPVFASFVAEVGMGDCSDCSIEEFTRLNRLAQLLLKSSGQDVTVLFDKQFSRLPAALTDLAKAIAQLDNARESSSGNYELTSLGQAPIDDLDKQWREAKAAVWPLSWFAKRKVTRVLQSYASGGKANPETDLRLMREMLRCSAVIDTSPLANASPHWRGVDTDTSLVEACLDLAKEVREAIVEVGQPGGTTNAISKSVYPALKGTTGEAAILLQARAFLSSSKQFMTAWKGFTEAARSMPVTKGSSSILADAIALAERIESNRTQLKQWTTWCELKQRTEALGLTPVVEALEASALGPEELADRFELAYARWWLPKAIDANESLREFQRFKHEDAIADFQKLDELARNTASTRAREGITHDLPESDKVPRKSELGLLRHQLGLKRPSKAIREVIAGMPDSFGQLAPCLLMSPLSIAQYLPADQEPFDVVVFDEASQITTWDAIGAIARGKQTIVVGDPKQLSPTNFFGKADDDEDDDDLDDFEKDLESILDETAASGIPTLQLNWHYRSRHESLISFSNWHYYGNKLVTFPAAETAEKGVSLRYVDDSLFDRGKSRTNRKEAQAIVDDAVSRMLACMEKAEGDRLTYGVITFNIQQQELIQDLFDEALRSHPKLEWFFSDDRIEPTAVKNLENVQGDERDVMYFSITFGFDAAGKFPVNFGALNRDGGERRLNVAVTRARCSLKVYSSFRAEQLRAERSQARGVHDLKNFLEYAEKGMSALPAQVEGSVGEFESPLEEAVAEALKSKGWQVEPQIGVSGFRVDLGVVHPDKPGAYLAGVECDGATYHRSAVARDRDKTRQQVLENLGWNIVRVWSPDWWYDCESAIERVHSQLTELLESDRAGEADDENSEEDISEVESDGIDVEEPDVIELAPGIPDDASADEAPEEAPPRVLVARHAADEPPTLYYTPTDLPNARPWRDRFFDDDYTPELKKMVRAVLETESPIREDVLARSIASVHGFGRTGAKLKSRILDVARGFTRTYESTGAFLWNATPQEVVPFRYAMPDEERRGVDETSIAELRGLIQSRPHFLNEDDPAVAYARQIGLSRLAKSARERIEEAIEMEQML